MHGGSQLLAFVLAATCAALAGCAGPALHKGVRPLEEPAPVAEARDERIHAVIDTIILRNGPGAWTRDAAWDEYVIRIRSLSDEPVEIREIAIFDSLGLRIEPGSDRSNLVVGRLPRSSSCQDFWEITAVRLGPVGLILAGSCIAEMRNDAAASKEIKRRQTPLPTALPGLEEARLDLFFPRAPRSGRAELIYSDRRGERRLDISIPESSFADPPPRLVSRVDPVFPEEARSNGVDKGQVTARLTLDPQGRVQDVELLQSVPQRVFDREARRTLRWWVYEEGRFEGRTVEASLEFRR